MRLRTSAEGIFALILFESGAGAGEAAAGARRHRTHQCRIILTCAPFLPPSPPSYPLFLPAFPRRYVAYKQIASGLYPALAFSAAHSAVQAPLALAESLVLCAMTYFMCGMPFDMLFDTTLFGNNSVRSAVCNRGSFF